MATDITIDLATLRFDGERFKEHTLDVECTQELITYRNLIVECAKELWRRKHPERVNLPKGFEKGFRLQFNRLEPGSAIIPLQRVRVDDQSDLDWGPLDEFDEAADLIDAAIAAANDDQLLPDALPSNVIPLFRDFGKTLSPDEVLFTRSRHGSAEVPYTAKARKRLIEWRVIGMAEFATRDRQIKRFIRVDEAVHTVLAVRTFDETAVPIWEQLSAIGESAPEGTWDSVPTDLSIRTGLVDECHRQGVGR